jgi:cytochrome P450
MGDLGTTTTSAPADGLRPFPFHRAWPFRLAEGYAAVAQEGGLPQVTFKGRPGWLVTRYQDVRSVLNNPGMSVRGIGDATRGADDDGNLPGFFLSMDPPEHRRLRSTLVREFTYQRMHDLRPLVQRIADELVDDLQAAPGRSGDLVEALALPLPSLVICELLGVPYADHDEFQAHTRAVLASDSTPEQVGAAIGAVVGYLRDLTVAKQADPGDDLISLLARHVESGEVSVDEVAGMGTLLLMAGHETTGNLIVLGIMTLLEHPDVLAALRADPALMPDAVEELLRYLDIIGNLPRTATEDLDIGGCPVRRGDLILVATDAANRDPTVFERPDVFDIQRDPARNLAFGYGIHTCLGAPLARVELQVVFQTLLSRIPTLRLAEPMERIPFKTENKIYGAHRLQVAW